MAGWFEVAGIVAVLVGVALLSLPAALVAAGLFAWWYGMMAGR